MTAVVTIDDVAAVALHLPETVQSERRGSEIWAVRDRTFAWIRPFTKADIKRFGDQRPPGGPILGVRVADLQDKEALLAEGRGGLFTIPHFDGFAAVLVQLQTVDDGVLEEVVVDAWLACAPPALVKGYLGS